MQTTTSAQPVNRFNWMDHAKAIGILLVVIGHSHFNHNELNEVLFTFHMPLFFILSGYLFKPKNIVIGLKKDFSSLVIPYVIYSALLFLISASRHPNAWCLLYTFTCDYKSGMACPAGWFLICLFWVRTLMNVLLYTKNRRWNGLIIITLAILYLFQAKWSFCLFTIELIPVHLLFFASGYYFRKYKSVTTERLKKSGLGIKIVTAFAGFNLLYVIYRLSGMHITAIFLFLKSGCPTALYIMTGIIGTISLVSFCMIFDYRSFRTTSILSNGTLLIMCLHISVLQLARKCFNVNQSDLLNLLVCLAIVAVFGLIIPFMSKHLPVLLGKKNVFAEIE